LQAASIRSERLSKGGIRFQDHPPSQEIDDHPETTQNLGSYDARELR